MFLTSMHATPPTARLPLHVPHKHGMALRHLLKFDHAQSPEPANQDEGSPLIIAICVGFVVTMLLILVCLFIVWHRRRKNVELHCEKCGGSPTEPPVVAAVVPHDNAAVLRGDHICSQSK
jgi:hypothetical protein